MPQIVNRNKKSQPVECKISYILLLSWSLVLSWIGLIVYSIRSGYLVAPKINTQSLRSEITSKLSSIIDKSIDISNSNNFDKIKLTDSDIYVIFSTDCTPFQDWQTLVLFYSAKLVNQQGPIIRIASGCDDTKKDYLTSLYKKLYPSNRVHFTPDFKTDSKTNKKYDFYNKPWGLKHWLEFSNPPLPDNIVIALLDPDMIFLRPLTTKISGQINTLPDPNKMRIPLIDSVEKGKPVAQLYGLGAPWTNDNHKKFNRGRICGEGSPCLKPNEQFGGDHYAVGPPYIAHISDMTRIAKTWTEFVPRVYEGYPHLLAEMYAYSMAAAHEELPHLQLHHFMVSNVDAGGEGWPWIDKLSTRVCELPVNNTLFPGEPMPTVVHFCQGYEVGGYMFYKRKLRKDIFSCEAPMLVDPPISLGAITNYQKEGLKEHQARRNAFMICAIHRTINLALEYYKSVMCPQNSSTNYEKSYNMIN